MKNVALITWASSGLGTEFAKLHAVYGGDVVLVARSEDKLNELAKELQNDYAIETYVIVKDLTKKKASQEIYDELSKQWIDIEILINNAGFGWVGKFTERKLKDDLSMIDLNIVALTELTHLFLKDFEARDHGRVLNVSSIASLIPWPMQAVYYATKAYVTSFSNAIAEELYDSQVTVTALLPGATETGFWETSGMDKTSMFSKPASAEEVAQTGYEAMLAGKLEVLAWVSTAYVRAMQLVPKKLLLPQVRKMQTVDKNSK